MANEDAREPSSVTGRALGTIALVGILGGGGVAAVKGVSKGVKGVKNVVGDYKKIRNDIADHMRYPDKDILQKEWNAAKDMNEAKQAAENMKPYTAPKQRRQGNQGKPIPKWSETTLKDEHNNILQKEWDEAAKNHQIEKNLKINNSPPNHSKENNAFNPDHTEKLTLENFGKPKIIESEEDVASQISSYFGKDKTIKATPTETPKRKETKRANRRRGNNQEEITGWNQSVLKRQ